MGDFPLKKDKNKNIGLKHWILHKRSLYKPSENTCHTEFVDAYIVFGPICSHWKNQTNRETREYLKNTEEGIYIVKENVTNLSKIGNKLRLKFFQAQV